MKEEELIKIWKSSSDEELVRREKSKLINDMHSDMDRYYKMMKSRDSISVILLFFAIPIFATMAYTIPSILSKIGAIIVLLSLVYLIIRIQRAKKQRPSSFSGTFLDYLYKNRAFLKVEKKLTDDNLYWFVLPVTIGAILKQIGSFNSTHELIIKILSTIRIVIIIYFYHKRMSKKLYVSRLERVEKLIKVMEK